MPSIHSATSGLAKAESFASGSAAPFGSISASSRASASSDLPPPITPISADEQRRALRIIDDYVFTDGRFALSPETLAQLGLDDGARLRLGNELASVVLHARAFDGLQPDVVVVESIWPNAAYEEGLGINSLVSADAGAPRGGAVFHDTAVWARPAS